MIFYGLIEDEEKKENDLIPPKGRNAPLSVIGLKKNMKLINIINFFFAQILYIKMSPALEITHNQPIIERKASHSKNGFRQYEGLPSSQSHGL